MDSASLRDNPMEVPTEAHPPARAPRRAGGPGPNATALSPASKGPSRVPDRGFWPEPSFKASGRRQLVK